MQGKLLMAFTAVLLVMSTYAMAKNGPPGATPSATAAGALTIVSATTSPGLNNQIIATLPVTGTTNDGSGDIVCAAIWDDGTVKVTQCLTVAVGATQTLTFTLNWNGSILTGAPGVGLYTYDATSVATPTTGTSLGVIDPVLPSAFAAISPVPTLSEWSLLLMATLVLLVGVAFARRRGHGPPAG